MRVLVVDDDMEVRELLTRAITRDGHTVTAVGAAAAARDVLDTTGADVMVLDLERPDDTGPVLYLRLGRSSSRTEGSEA